MSPLIILLASSATIYLIYTLLSHLSRCHIPSAHPTSSFSSLWVTRLRHNGKIGISTLLRLHYPPSSPPVPILRLSPTEISVASLEGLRTIYTGGFGKDEFYTQFANYGGVRNMVSMLGNREHAVRKKMLSSVYTKSFIQSSAQIRDLTSALVYERLGPVLRKVVSEGKEKGGGGWGELDAYALNLAMGADFTSAFLLGVESCTNFIQDLSAGRSFVKLWLTKSRELPGHQQATTKLEAYILTLVRKSRGEKDGEEGIVRSQLTSQLNTKHEKTTEEGDEKCDMLAKQQHEEEEKIIASEIFDHLIAGVETARITLTYLQHELSLPHNSSLQSSLRAELRSLSPPIILSSPVSPTSNSHSDANSDQNPPKISTSKLPTAKQLDALPLLEAILKETLRMYPPSPAPLPRVVPSRSSTTILHGFPIPPGTTIGSSAHVLHQNPLVFPEPRAFKPERWLVKPGDEVGEAKLREMNRYFWVFASGARMCIGSHFAVYMLKTITAALYTSFETRIIDDEGIEQEDAFLSGPVGEKLILGLRAIQ